MNRLVNSLATLVLPSLLLLSTVGCKTVVRENIVSSVQTGIGVTLAENPKTELYEAKVGYIRSQFYSVPTGKNVESDDPQKLSNAVNLTPELVSGIRVETEAKHLMLGASISESFAVGKVAVMSPAAIAMYIANAKSDKTAKEAAKAVDSTAIEWARIQVDIESQAADEVIAALYAGGEKLDSAKLTKAIKGTALENQSDKITTLTKAELLRRLHPPGVWSRLAVEMRDNLSP